AAARWKHSPRKWQARPRPMATQADVRRIALSLKGTVEAVDDFAFGIPREGKLKKYAWVWKERIHPTKPRVRHPKGLALRTSPVAEKEFLLDADSEKFFPEPHYDGYPAILIRLAAVTARDLRPLMKEAWQCQASLKTAKKRKRS